jgi:hypothetical protein
MSDVKDYTEEVQELFIRFLISDADLFARCQNIVHSEFFNRKFKPTVDLLVSHSTNYTSIPTIEQINAVGGLNLEKIEKIYSVLIIFFHISYGTYRFCMLYFSLNCHTFSLVTWA